MLLGDNPNKELKKIEIKYYLSPVSPPFSLRLHALQADGALGSVRANVYLCVFAGNWRILTVIISRLIITTVKVLYCSKNATFFYWKERKKY